MLPANVHPLKAKAGSGSTVQEPLLACTAPPRTGDAFDVNAQPSKVHQDSYESTAPPKLVALLESNVQLRKDAPGAGDQKT